MQTEHEESIRSEVVARVFERRVAAAAHNGGQPLSEVINETLYHELERLRHEGGSLHPDEERAFYGQMRRSLPHANAAAEKQMLREVLERYAREITGHFSPAVYGIATRAIPLALTGLLNGLSPLRLATRVRSLASLENQVVIQGEVEHARKLQKRGTLVFVPTHSSNLDSVIMGYAIYRMGLPPFMYGAGLNLFHNPIIGFFMRNLGAYTVDRRKSDPLYREALKEYTTVTLEFGYHNLFFPGGTRSRDNCVETHLKKGLLGTTVNAYYNNLRRRRERPDLYIVPCTISYPLVLEASTLIEDHLRRDGKSRYIIEDDEFSQVRRWVDFARGLVNLEQRIYMTVAPPLDPFGNRVDEEGRSLDPRGRVIDPARYLMAGGKLRADGVRDVQYTNDLATRVAESFRAHNVALPTHVLAFAFFRRLRRQDPESDLYRFLRGLGPETTLALTDVEQEVELLLRQLRDLAAAGKILLDDRLAAGSVSEVVRAALRSFGTYHTRPVIHRRGVRLHPEDANLMLYYRNRLSGYGLSLPGEESREEVA